MSRPGRRRGVQLVEVLLAVALVGTLIAMLVGVMADGRREEAHHELRETLLGSATLLHELLARDARISLELGVLDAEEVPRGTPGERLVLPVFTAYQGDADTARSFRRVEYRWDASRRVLTRDGRQLPLPGLGEVRFRWSDGAPTVLEVALEGRGGGPGGTPHTRFVVPAPPGTDRPGLWRPAAHHLGAIGS